MSGVVGIDLGGTKVAAALLRGGDSSVGESIQHPTRLTSADELIDQLVAIVAEVRGEHEIDGVGIGVPSIVQFATGTVVSSVNIPLQDVPLRHVLSDRLGVPAFVDNDATVAALAEAHDEQLQLVAENLVMLTIGTGVGGGIVLGGRIFRGSTGAAGEIGHTLIGLPAGDLTGADNEIPPAGEHFAQPGSLEYLASGHALDRIASAVASAEPESAIGRRAADGTVLGRDIVAAARAGDAAAAAGVRRWARAVGIGIANAINTFDPEEVVIGGGAAAAGDLLLVPAVDVAAGYVVPGLRGHANVRMARFGARAGVVGAALLARQELEQNTGPAATAGAFS